MNSANVIFQPFGIGVVSGHRFLGGFIGFTDSTREWISCIMELSKAAEKYYSLDGHIRVVPDCSAAFAPV